MRAGAIDFKDASGRTLREDMNAAAKRATASVLTGSPIQESDIKTIKAGTQRQSPSAEVSTKRASRTAQNQRSGTTGAGAGDASRARASRVVRKTLLGDA